MKIILSIIGLLVVLAIALVQVGKAAAQPDLPELPSDTLLEDPESSDFESDIFFDDFETDTAAETDTTTETDTAADSAADTTISTPATVSTTTVADTATGSPTHLVFTLAAVMAFITWLIIISAKIKHE